MSKTRSNIPSHEILHEDDFLEDGTVIHATTEEEWGTIFTSTGEKVIEPIQEKVKTPPVEAKAFDEEEYFAKLRAKGTQMATSILSEARQEAESLLSTARQEAKNIAEQAKTNGHAEGYAAGHAEGTTKGHEEAYQHSLEETKEELDALRSNMADSVAAVVSAIEGETESIYTDWRDDIIAVCRLAVEKISAVQLEEERVASLTTLLNEAIATLKKDRRLLITVNPEDEPVIADILDSTKAKYPDITMWDVRPNAEISPGGLVVESEYSLAESLVESRKAAVTTILSHLTLSK